MADHDTVCRATTRQPTNIDKTSTVEPKRVSDGSAPESDRDEAIRANIVAAQLELDALLASRVTDVASVTNHLVRASLYLSEAEPSAPASNKTNASISSALVSFHAAFAQIVETMKGPDHANLVVAVQVHITQIEASHTRLMKRYGVGAGTAASSRYAPTLQQRCDASGIEVDAMRASLVVAKVEATRGFRWLIDAGDDARVRLPIITTIAPIIEGHLSHAALMMGSGFDETQLAAIQPAVEAASASVLLIKRWIDKREGNASLRAAFRATVAATNAARARVGLGALDLEEVRGFPEREEAEEAQEQRDMEAAFTDLEAAWGTVRSGMEEGVEEWFELAKQAKEHAPDFLKSVLASLLEEALGKIGGLLAKRLFDVAATAAAKNLTIHLKGSVGGSLKDALVRTTGNATKGLAAKAVAAATKEAAAMKGGAADLKALLFVRGGLKAICSSFVEAHVHDATESRRQGELSIADVKQLREIALAIATTANDDLKRQSATEWMRYVAQANTQDLRHDERATTNGLSHHVTELGGYFGTYYKEGPRTKASRQRNHEGKAGMLRVTVTTYEEGLNGRTGLLDIERIEALELNDDIARLVLSGEAIKTLDDVKVPKEVIVKFKIYTGMGSHEEPSVKLVVDETGMIKDVYTNTGIEGPSAADLAQALPLWSRVRALPVSPSLVRRK